MVNKLYLAHNFGSRKKMRKWELRLEREYYIILDNPFYDSDRSDVENLDRMKDGSKEQRKYFESHLSTKHINRIVDGDLECIRKSDGIVAYVKGSIGIGTQMEIFFAARVLQIPVYIITKKWANHPWIQKYATEIFIYKKDFEKFIKNKYGLRHGL